MSKLRTYVLPGDSYFRCSAILDPILEWLVETEPWYHSATSGDRPVHVFAQINWACARLAHKNRQARDFVRNSIFNHNEMCRNVLEIFKKQAREVIETGRCNYPEWLETDYIYIVGEHVPGYDEKYIKAPYTLAEEQEIVDIADVLHNRKRQRKITDYMTN